MDMLLIIVAQSYTFTCFIHLCDKLQKGWEKGLCYFKYNIRNIVCEKVGLLLCHKFNTTVIMMTVVKDKILDVIS